MSSLKTEMSAEQVKSLYFSDDAILIPKENIYRLDSGGVRCYYTVTERKKAKKKVAPLVNVYVSVTSIIHKTLPTSPFLIKWIAEQGYNEAEEFKEMKADYGTLMHIEIGKLLIAREYDLDDIPATVMQYVTDNDVKNYKFNEWCNLLKQDVLGFAKFMIEYNVVPLAIEMPLVSEKYKTAGTMDIFCKMDVQLEGYWGEKYKSGENKGKKKLTKKPVTIKAIIDNKSSRKGTYEEHEIQLKFYEEMFKENYPEYADEEIRLYNWRPKNWLSEPSYSLTDQTGKHDVEKLELITKLFFKDNTLEDRTKLVTSGVINIDSGNLGDNYKVWKLKDIILDKNFELV